MHRGRGANARATAAGLRDSSVHPRSWGRRARRARVATGLWLWGYFTPELCHSPAPALTGASGHRTSGIPDSRRYRPPPCGHAGPQKGLFPAARPSHGATSSRRGFLPARLLFGATSPRLESPGGSTPRGSALPATQLVAAQLPAAQLSPWLSSPTLRPAPPSSPSGKSRRPPPHLRPGRR